MVLSPLVDMDNFGMRNRASSVRDSHEDKANYCCQLRKNIPNRSDEREGEERRGEEREKIEEER